LSAAVFFLHSSIGFYHWHRCRQIRPCLGVSRSPGKFPQLEACSTQYG
jgi:hypothetical protein